MIFFKVYELRELTLENEISGCLESAMQYGKKYKDVHIELKMGLEQEYEERYPECEKVVGNLIASFLLLFNNLRDVKKRSEGNRKEEEKLEKISGREERKITLECEHDFFLAKLKRKFSTPDWDRINDYNEISLGINVFETSLDEW